MFSKLKEEIVSKFEEKLKQQMTRIEKLEGKMERETNRIDTAKKQIALQKNMLDQWEIKCDGNEQYKPSY